mgnify:CR=1 FL=1
MADFGVGGAGSGNNINFNKGPQQNKGADPNEFSKIFADLMGDDELELKERKKVFDKNLTQAKLSQIPTAHEMIRASAASGIFEVKKFFKKAGIIPEFDLNEEDYKGIHQSLVDVLEDEGLIDA